MTAGFNEIGTYMTQLDTSLAALTAHVATLKDVITSAEAAFRGIGARITSAVADALTAGASPDQIASLTALDTEVQAESTGLAAAVASGTPAVTPAVTSTAPVEPTPAVEPVPFEPTPVATTPVATTDLTPAAV